MDASSRLSPAGISEALQSPLLNLAGSAALLGVVLHVSIFRTIYVEEYLYNLLGVYVAAVVGIVSCFVSLTALSAVEILQRIFVLCVSFNTGLVFSIGVYRLLFHRLRRFPGPFGAKLTRFYDTYLAGKNVQYYKEVEKLHRKHGDFIRTGQSTSLFSVSGY